MTILGWFIVVHAFTGRHSGPPPTAGSVACAGALAILAWGFYLVVLTLERIFSPTSSERRETPPVDDGIESTPDFFRVKTAGGFVVVTSRSLDLEGRKVDWKAVDAVYRADGVEVRFWLPRGRTVVVRPMTTAAAIALVDACDEALRHWRSRGPHDRAAADAVKRLGRPKR